MATKLLIAYGSWAESTREIAFKMAEKIKAEKNFKVEVLPANEVKELSSYQAVIIGSGVRAGMFHSSIVKFIKKFRKELIEKPSAFFICCLTMKEDTEANRNEASSYMKKLYSKVPEFKPVELGLFGGVVNFDKLPFLFRKMFENSNEITEGDFRDWDKINLWALETSDKLLLQNK